MIIENIFFDRDGVINEVVPRIDEISSPRCLEEFKLRLDFTQMYAQLPLDRLNTFVVSNQPDVSRKLLPQEQLAQMTEILKAKFAFKEIVYCPHDDDDQCSCRKPKPGMLNDLLAKYNLDKEKSLFVGDTWKDIYAGEAAGVKTVYLRQSHNFDPADRPDCRPDYVVHSLVEILNIIASQK